jgi:hypothetical protein
MAPQTATRRFITHEHARPLGYQREEIGLIWLDLVGSDFQTVPKYRSPASPKPGTI